jgi:hypothetical protein
MGKLILSRDVLIIGSNLKTNLVILLFFWKKKIIIINGLGRFRRSKLLRLFLIFLIKYQFRNNKIFIQNYADYRYFRSKNLKSTQVHWLPGSGGVKRQLGSTTSNVAVITRESKLPTQINSLKDFARSDRELRRLAIVGVEYTEASSLSDFRFDFMGYVSQNDILSFSNNLLVPDGYGEGIPHTLVDALSSGARIFLSKRNYIGYGFYKYQKFEGQLINNFWIDFTPNINIVELVSVETIVEIVYREAIALLNAAS